MEFHAKSGEESNVVDPKQVSSPQVATNSAEPSHLPAEVRSEAAWAIDAPETSRSGRGGDGGSEATESAEELLNEVSAHATLSPFPVCRMQTSFFPSFVIVLLLVLCIL